MPSLNFVLPHWLYWSALLVVPLFGMVVVRRMQGRRRPSVSIPIAYMLWLCGGFLGIHRFYLKSWLGLVYVPLFLAIIYGNVHVRDARLVLSNMANQLSIAEFDVERFQEAVEEGEEGAAADLAKAEQALAGTKQNLVAATARHDFWLNFSGGFALAIAILLVIDAVLIPGLVRRRAAREAAGPPPEEAPLRSTSEVPQASLDEDPSRRVHSPVSDAIDWLSGWTGEFVAYWSIIAVFAYYYEVIARYVFNSPTNWVHESMFLMFGMQYLISGAYALREDAHVRVDVLYVHLSDRAKAVTDILTSIFFFIFTVTLLVTGWIFMMDSISVREVSFTEWAIQYWPVKIALPLGALLIVLQGLSKLIRDVILLRRLMAA